MLASQHDFEVIEVEPDSRVEASQWEAVVYACHRRCSAGTSTLGKLPSLQLHGIP
jgi:hypothetical protein